MGYGSFFQGLSQGYGQRFQRDQTLLANKRQQEQTDLNERRVRNQELDSVQREARRVAEQDRADEQQTMQMLMQPGLTEESRKAIRDARVARRTDNTAYIRSLSADPTKAADITKRFGDITKLITPSTIEAGVMPSPTVDMLKATEYADKFRKEIGLLPEQARAPEVKYRQQLLANLGLNPDQIQQLLPDFGKVMGTTKGKVSDWQKVDVPFNLPESLMFGGKQYDPETGRYIETQLGPDGKTLQKRYMAPDIEQKMTYEPDIIQTAKAEKHKYEAPRIQAQIAKLKAETEAIPMKLKMSAQDLTSKIADRKDKANIARLLMDVRRQSNDIRAWGLSLANTRGQQMLGLRSRALDIAEGKVGKAQQAKLSEGITKMRTELNEYKAKYGKAMDEQRTAEGQQLAGIIGFLETQISQNEQALTQFNSDEGLDFLLQSEGIQYTPPTAYPGYGGLGGYPGVGYGGGGYAAPAYGGGGGTTYSVGGQPVSLDQLAAIMAQGGYNAASNASVGKVGGAKAAPQKGGRVLIDAAGKPIDISKVIGAVGKVSAFVNVGGRRVPITISAGQADFEAVQRTIEQQIAQAMKKAK